jgi:Xaa-Pro aminopeptidase
MQTLQPTLRLGRDVWDRTAMPVAEFHHRADRLRSAMAEAGLDAMLLYGRGLNACGHPTYLANYIVKLPFAALVVLPRIGEPALAFEGATRGREAAKATTWIEDVRPCWNIAETCLSILEDRGLATTTIGLAGMPRLVPFDEWRLLADGLSRARLVDAEALVDRRRAVKSPREIAQMRRASRIVDLAVQHVGAIRGVPFTESDLAAQLVRSARTAGAEDIRLMLARPQEPDWAFRPPENRRLDPGDQVILHLAVSWERYWWEATRTFCLQSGSLEPVWTDDLDTRFRQLVAMASPDTAVRDFVRGARTILTASEWQTLELCGLGHGIGVMAEEAPVMTDSCGDVLLPGMGLVVRAAFDHRESPVIRGETIIL